MNGKEFVASLDSAGMAEVAAELPDGVLARELIRRGLVAPELGSATLAAAAHQEARIYEDPLKASVGEFLSDDNALSVHEQLNTMTEVWLRLGLTPPAPNDTQLERVQGRLNKHPDHRVLAVPLLGIDDFKTVAERAKDVLPDNKFGQRAALWVLNRDSTAGMLLRDPEAIVDNGVKRYGLRYHTKYGVLTRTELVGKLTEDGQIVQAEDGTFWLFPVMDVTVNIPRQTAFATDLLQLADMTQVPESLITVQLLYQAGYTPNLSGPELTRDFTNQAIYELDSEGKVTAPVYMSYVSWNPDAQQIELFDWGLTSKTSRSCIRAVESEQ